MPQLMRYDSAAMIPLRLEAQIRSLLYAEWPASDEDEVARPLIDPELHPVYFVIAEGGQVLSYARTIWATVTHFGQSFKFYGLGDVITKPEVRYKGYGGRIVRVATTYIKSDCEADAAVLLTEPKLEMFYRGSGWDYVAGLRVVTGERDKRVIFPIMLFLSGKAQAVRATFATDTLVLPGDEW